MDPYRLAENDKIIIDTRLDALERQNSSTTMWRWPTFIIAVISFVACGVLVMDRRANASITADCVDEVVIASHSAFATTQTMKCSHPKHHSSMSQSATSTTIRCTCQ